MSLDSHVVDRGSRPGPGGLKLTPGACACVRACVRACVHACPRSRGESGGEGIAAAAAWPSPLGGDFSLSVSLSLSVCLASARTLWQITSPKKKK